MEWKIDEVCMEWMIGHLDLYQGQDEEANRVIQELKSAWHRRMSAYSEYTEAKQHFLECLCNNYILYRSGLCRFTDKTIVITGADGYLMYQADKDRWIPIGYLREKRLPYTNRSFVERMNGELAEFRESVAREREKWIDQEVGNNLRLLRDVRYAWVHILGAVLLLGCDLALLCYFADCSGLWIWLRLLTRGEADSSFLLRFSLFPQNITGKMLLAAAGGSALVLLLLAGLIRDILLVGKVKSVQRVIRRYSELEKQISRLGDRVRGCDLETVNRELDAFCLTAGQKRLMPPAGSRVISQKAIRICRRPAVCLHLLTAAGLGIFGLLCMYFRG